MQANPLWQEQISVGLSTGEGGRTGMEGGISKRHEELPEVMVMFIIFIVVIASWLCKYVKTYQGVSSNMYHVLCVDYNSIMLFLKGKHLKNYAAF